MSNLLVHVLAPLLGFGDPLLHLFLCFRLCTFELHQSSGSIPTKQEQRSSYLTSLGEGKQSCMYETEMIMSPECVLELHAQHH
jgi:hypothetical protein